METSNIENKKIKEKYSDFEDFQDYKSSKSVKKFFTIKGILKAIAIVFMFVLVINVGLLLIDYLIPITTVIPSILILLSGIGIYFLNRSLKKKTNLFIKKTNEFIKLSSPLYIDILSFFSIIVFLFGVILVLFNIYLLNGSTASIYFGGMCYIWTIIYCFTLYKKYRHSLFDKIIIFKEYLLIDNPDTNETIRISKEEISKIIELRLIAKGMLEKRIIEFHFLNESKVKTIEIGDDDLKNMRLSIDLFLDYLKAMGYSIDIQIFTFGQTNRTDVNGNQIQPT